MSPAAVLGGLLLGAVGAAPWPLWAFDFQGDKALIAVTGDGAQTRIGTVQFTAQHGTASADQLAWLEHNLLFFFKQPADFGAKLWNGIIFRFAVTPTALIGTPQAVDLNRIGVPPDNPQEPPYGRFDRDDFPAGARWVRELRIE